MKLTEIVEQIRVNQEKVLEMDQMILNAQLDKLTLNAELESKKLIFCRQVYFSDDYKNDKQREIAVKENCKHSSEYIHFESELLEVNEIIQNLEYKKSKIMIDLAYYKNLLRVAEIEAMKVKAGV